MLPAPDKEISAIETEANVAATAAINNCFFILKTPKFYKLCKMILAFFLNIVVKMLRIIRINLHMSTLICKINTINCKYTTHTSILNLTNSLKTLM
jgi:hypothetical protein